MKESGVTRNEVWALAPGAAEIENSKQENSYPHVSSVGKGGHNYRVAALCKEAAQKIEQGKALEHKTIAQVANNMGSKEESISPNNSENIKNIDRTKYIEAFRAVESNQMIKKIEAQRKIKHQQIFE